MLGLLVIVKFGIEVFDMDWSAYRSEVDIAALLPLRLRRLPS
jgi:hypothetical protein